MDAVIGYWKIEIGKYKTDLQIIYSKKEPLVV